jgi:hypothetical protein
LGSKISKLIPRSYLNGFIKLHFACSPKYPDYVWDQYATSVKMSTYLVAFVISEFDYVESLADEKFKVQSSITPMKIYIIVVEHAFIRCGLGQTLWIKQN